MIHLPYGSRTLKLDLTGFESTIFQPKMIKPDDDQAVIVENALNKWLRTNNNGLDFTNKSVAIGINDQSRPLPNHILLPVLLDNLKKMGVKNQNITFFIATGTHTPLKNDEFSLVLDNKIFSTYKVVCHDCDDIQRQIYLGETSAGTPVFVNSSFMNSDIKILVGSIESHHFMGFSGGVKTAAIGLTGRETITANHSMLSHMNTTMGLYSSNPMRMDVEDIGRMINIDFVLNVVLNDNREIITAYTGDPAEVMSKGIDFIRKNVQMDLKDSAGTFDLVIASPGGYPKDINFYQSQKAITHACLFSKPEGVIILAAECRDGMGSRKFEQYLTSKDSFNDVIESFKSLPFEIGPHKAFQLAKQAINHKIILVSDMTDDVVKNSKLLPARSLGHAIKLAGTYIQGSLKIAVLPFATHTMPKIAEAFLERYIDMQKSIPIFEHPELDGKSFFLKGNQIGLLLIHGFTATTVEVRWLADYFSKKSFTLSAPLLPGHGTTPEDLNKQKYIDWIKCVDDAYATLKKTCSSVIVGGESMGAVLSLYLAQNHPEIKALLLYSPAIKISSLKYSKIFRHFIPIVRKKDHDEIMPWQGYSVYPLFAASEFLQLQKLVFKKLHLVKTPMIVFQGAYDKTIDPDSSDLIIASVKSSIKTKYIMENSGHVILLDKEFSKTAELTWKFVNELKIV